MQRKVSQMPRARALIACSDGNPLPTSEWVAAAAHGSGTPPCNAHSRRSAAAVARWLLTGSVTHQESHAPRDCHIMRLGK